jgi:hypothetical protein
LERLRTKPLRGGWEGAVIEALSVIDSLFFYRRIIL